MKQQQIIGIFGGSASGKTVLAHKIHELGGKQLVSSIALDSYYNDQSHKTFEERLKTNYDHPDAFEIELLCSHLNSLKQNQAVQIPIYDYVQHTRSPEKLLCEPAPIILVEGILAGHFPQLLKQFTLSIFCEASDSVRFDRRCKRDIAERGRTLESVKTQWETLARPMFDQYIAPTQKQAQLLFTEADDITAFAKKVLERVSS